MGPKLARVRSIIQIRTYIIKESLAYLTSLECLNVWELKYNTYIHISICLWWVPLVYAHLFKNVRMNIYLFMTFFVAFCYNVSQMSINFCFILNTNKHMDIIYNIHMYVKQFVEFLFMLFDLLFHTRDLASPSSSFLAFRHYKCFALFIQCFV